MHYWGEMLVEVRVRIYEAEKPPVNVGVAC
jgi:hypothetical protein